MTRKDWAIVLLGVLVLMLACGGGGGSSSSAPTQQQPGTPPTVTHNTQPGFPAVPMFYGSTHVTLAESRGFSLIPRAYAQTPSQISMTGNYSGFCLGTPQGRPAAVSIAVYGAGRWDAASLCDTSWFNTPEGAALNSEGAPVIGNGTIGNLVVKVAASSVQVSSSSGKVQVFVRRSGQVLDTAITCTLAKAVKCTDTRTFAVVDDDEIVITATVQPGDAYRNLRVFLGKS